MTLTTTKILTAVVLLSLIGAPTLSFAKARGGGGGGGGFSSGSRGGGTSGGIGSRGSRTYDNNGYRPIERSTAAKPASPPPQPATVNPTPAPAAQPAPARQPSFLQRHPLLAGIAGGLAGSWIGHMLFGGTNSEARTSDAETREGDNASGSSGSTGLLLLLMLVAGGALYYFMKARRPPQPEFSVITGRSGSTGSPLGGSPLLQASAANGSATALQPEVTPADQAAFQHILIEVQTAWSKQDLSALRRLVTPEMLSYFSNALSEQTSQETENRVEDVSVVSAEVREAWTEDATEYATVLLRWKARDYTVSLTKQRGEPGYLIEGNDQAPTESSEAWTFMRSRHGKWLLSAIQQVE